MDDVTKYQCRAEAFKSSFFPRTITESNSLDLQILWWIQTNRLFNIHNPVGIKLLTRLRLGLSHLNEHRFNHKFQNCTSPKCICSFENESTTHFFLHCHFYIPIRATLFDNLKEIVNNLQDLSDQAVTIMLLYDSPNLKGNQNSQILECTIKFIMDSKRLPVLCFSVGILLFFFVVFFVVFFFKLRIGLRFLHFFINPLISLLKSINKKKLYWKVL